DPHAIAEAQKRRAGLALAQGFHRALLGDAGVARAALRDRAARSPVFLVRYGAGADDAARLELTRAGGVRQQGRKIDRPVDAGVRPAAPRAVDEAPQRQ